MPNPNDFGESLLVEGLLANTENPVILDLGACKGEDSAWLAQCGKGKARVIAVEADPENFALLKANTFDVEMIHAAIGPYSGTCEFYQSRECGGGFGSIYKPQGPMSCSLESFHKIGPIDCFTLDTLYYLKNLERIDLIWTDLHGAEKDMIAFGQQALRRTRYLMMEFFHERLYEGMATLPELLAMLPGWSVVKTFTWNVLMKNEAI